MAAADRLCVDGDPAGAEGGVAAVGFEKPVFKFQRTGKLEVFLHLVDGAIGLGLISGAALAAIVGQFILGGILTALAIGMFLRFKRGRVRK